MRLFVCSVWCVRLASGLYYSPLPCQVHSSWVVEHGRDFKRDVFASDLSTSCSNTERLSHQTTAHDLDSRRDVTILNCMLTLRLFMFYSFCVFFCVLSLSVSLSFWRINVFIKNIKNKSKYRERVKINGRCRLLCSLCVILIIAKSLKVWF